MDIKKFEEVVIAVEVKEDKTGEKLDASYDATKVSPESLEKLCNGFIKLYVDNLKCVTSPLDELNRNQEVLIETIQQENARFDEAKHSLSLEEMFSRIAQYQSKLVVIKKDMVALHEKAVKLKKRSLKLQTLKEKESGPKDSAKLT